MADEAEKTEQVEEIAPVEETAPETEMDEFLKLGQAEASSESEETPEDKVEVADEETDKPEVDAKADTEDSKEKDESSEKSKEAELSKKESPDDEDKKADEEKSDAEDKKANSEDKPAEKSVAEIELEEKLTLTEKRRVDTLRWANDLSQQNAQLKRHTAILEAKLQDPDYDPATDPDLQAREQAQADAMKEAEIRADLSLQAAYDKYDKQENKGRSYVDQKLQEFKQKFGGDRATQERILASDMPVQTAIDTVNFANFLEEVGSTDPDQIMSTVEKKVEARLRPKIREEERAKVLSEIKNTTKAKPGLRKARSADTDTGKKVNPEQPKPLENLFGQ